MRILHTSDWHLGKRLFKLDRLAEHAQFLDWLIELIKIDQIDLLLIAGDIFDTPNPSHQSLELFYHFLHRLSTESEVQTLMIAGNHDSGLLLEAPAKILAPHRVKVWGKLSKETKDHWVHIKIHNESVDICAIPFFRSYELLSQGEEDPLKALQNYLYKEKTNPQILMIHHLAGIFEAAGSEQVITLSGVDSIPCEVFKCFDYVALGHIHKPQKIAQNIYYSGSPIAMRFSETHDKSLIKMVLENGQFQIEKIKIPQPRSLHIVKANELTWRDKIRALNHDCPLTPQVEVQLSLTRPITGIIDEIKEEIAHKKMELLSYLPQYVDREKKKNPHEKLFELSPMDLFKEFYRHKYPESKELPDDLQEDFKNLVQKVINASD